MMRNGTAILESKTGYGTNAETEEKMLKVMERIESDLELHVKKTLLAHVIPKDITEKQFLKNFKEMIEEFKNRIDYVDVFVDEGAFSPAFAEDAIRYANGMGIPGRVHLNELRNLGGIEALKNLDIKSFDHMIDTRRTEIDKIKGAVTVLPFPAMLGMTLLKPTSVTLLLWAAAKASLTKYSRSRERKGLEYLEGQRQTIL